MKLTKAQESEVLKIYKTYFDSYIHGDTETIAQLLDDGYNQIGSADGEVFFNKKDALKFLYDTIDQVAGKTQIQNREIRVDQLKEFFLVTDLFDIYVSIDNDWAFYARFRASTLMQKKKDGWKFLHQHSSMPDSKTQEGENISIEKRAEENSQLREAVRRRTIELEQRNRELEIEASLEKVRTRTMAMNSSEELSDVLSVLFEQFDTLGIKPSFAHLTLFDEENDTFSFRMTGLAGQRILVEQIIDINKVEAWQSSYQQWKEGDKNRVNCIDYPPEALPQIWEIMAEIFDALPEGSKMHIEDFPNGIYTTQGHCKFGYLGFNHTRRATEEEKAIVIRFATEFGRLYQRYLDIQKAEAQAREAQIEAVLERIRAKALAMHRSEDFIATSLEVFHGLRTLGIDIIRSGLSVVTDETKMEWEAWSITRGKDEQVIPMSSKFTSDVHTVSEKIFQHWQNKDPFFTIELDGDDLKSFVKSMPRDYVPVDETTGSLPMNVNQIIFHYFCFPKGVVFAGAGYHFMQDEISIMQRFTNVFAFAYTRYLDLKNAEKQAREALIEVALERVRARTMAMHRSEELGEVAARFYRELQSLGFQSFFNCGYVEVDEEKRLQYAWLTDSDGTDFGERMVLPLVGDQVFDSRFKSWKRKDPVFSQKVKGVKLKNHLEFAMSNSGSERGNEMVRTRFPESVHFYCGNFSKGYLHIITENKLSKDEELLLIRFTAVFELTYTRFLDLQKAETQAREAQIEAALERVRASSMAMHQSGDLNKVLSTMFTELTSLEFELARCVIWIYHVEDKSLRWYAANPEAEVESYLIPYHNYKVINDYWEAWEKRIPRMYYDLSGELKKGMDEYLFNHTEMAQMPKEVQDGMITPEQVHIYNTFNDFGALLVPTIEQQNEEIYSILERFGNVFNQSYTRFKDLKKAEAQAKEAQIEAALERIRARASGMHSSDELLDVGRLLYIELEKLGIKSFKTGYVLMENGGKIGWNYGTNSADGTIASKPVGTPHTETPVMKAIAKSWRMQKPYLILELDPQETIDHQTYIAEHSINYPYTAKELISFSPERLVLHTFNFNNGYLLLLDGEKLKDIQAEMMIRFTRVFEQTYTRFVDLKNAEAQAREAVKQASLDRVRGEIASMRSTEDLNRITPLIWKELTTLDVPFIRCGVFIVNEEQEVVQSYLSAPDGKTLGIFELPFTAEMIGKDIVEFWRKGNIYREHWDKGQFIEFMNRLLKMGQLKDQEQFQGAESPPERLELHFIPFGQGMLYVGNVAPLDEDKLSLVELLAEAFSIAFARYEDFKELEAAKNRIEITLNELKTTQSQLIHAEKMASLGELTAGIAHEIQNPLNFVNNFSEVSVDLIEELKESRSKANGERDESLEEEILQDLIQNLEKISFHGGRASSIVNGMLQHSRNSSKEKEPTDINALCDEYLRLAYHGLRAKDKSFNAEYKFNLDPLLPKLEVVPQEIGRVLLNLINNAFYVVNTKVKGGIDGYKPEVVVSTRCKEKRIEISVKDNGPGIPEAIKDKIFQPFFTTKPTGQGTGLGLSISYDIVKAHGGELKVETNDGKGSEFIIQLHF